MNAGVHQDLEREERGCVRFITVGEKRVSVETLEDRRHAETLLRMAGKPGAWVWAEFREGVFWTGEWFRTVRELAREVYRHERLYRRGRPTLTDEQFDRMVDALGEFR